MSTSSSSPAAAGQDNCARTPRDLKHDKQRSKDLSKALHVLDTLIPDWTCSLSFSVEALHDARKRTFRGEEHDPDAGLDPEVYWIEQAHGCLALLYEPLRRIQAAERVVKEHLPEYLNVAGGGALPEAPAALPKPDISRGIRISMRRERPPVHLRDLEGVGSVVVWLTRDGEPIAAAHTRAGARGDAEAALRRRLETSADREADIACRVEHGYYPRHDHDFTPVSEGCPVAFEVGPNTWAHVCRMFGWDDKTNTEAAYQVRRCLGMPKPPPAPLPWNAQRVVVGVVGDLMDADFNDEGNHMNRGTVLGMVSGALDRLAARQDCPPEWREALTEPVHA